MSRRTLIGAVALFTVGAATGGLAYSRTAPLTTLDMIRQLSVRTDAIQARIDATGPPATSTESLDVLAAHTIDGEPYASVQGWAFGCSDDDDNYAVEYVVVDDIELPTLPVSRVDRPDVVAALTGFCPPGQQVPERIGVNFEIPMRIFGAGTSGNQFHAFKLRTYDAHGRSHETPYRFLQVPMPASR